MREYFILKSKNKLLFIFILFSLLIIGCHPGYIVPGEVDVFIKSPIVHPRCNHLVIFPFKTSEKSDGIHPSVNVAKLFNQEISSNNYTNKITLIEDKTVFSNMEEIGLQIQRALYIANNKKADLMMLGSIDYYFDSVSIDTKVIVSTMIISVKTGKKLWWGTQQVTGKTGKKSFLFGDHMTPDPPTAQDLLNHAVEMIVYSIFCTNTF
jgi:hypothetical protein